MCVGHPESPSPDNKKILASSEPRRQLTRTTSCIGVGIFLTNHFVSEGVCVLGIQRVRRLIKKILASSEPRRQLTRTTSCDAQNACFEGPKPSCGMKTQADNFGCGFLLTVGSFLLTMRLFCLQLTILAFLLTVGALAYSFSFFTHSWSFLAYSGKVRLIRALKGL